MTVKYAVLESLLPHIIADFVLANCVPFFIQDDGQRTPDTPMSPRVFIQFYEVKLSPPYKTIGFVRILCSLLHQVS